MTLFSVGVSYRTAPTALVERFSTATGEIIRQVGELCSATQAEAFVLSTCNRVEVYVDHSEGVGPEQLLALLAGASRLTPPEVAAVAAIRDDTATVTHLFSVACGLDSMALGETEVVGQIRRARDRCSQAGVLGPRLGRLLDASLRASKKVRSATEVNRAGRSLIEAGLTLALRELGTLNGRSAVVVGAGSMAAAAAIALRSFGVADVLVMSRTSAHAEKVAAQVGGRALPIDQLIDGMGQADIVVVASSSPTVVIAIEDVARALNVRADRGLLILDLTMPRNVDVSAAGLTGVCLVDLDAIALSMKPCENTGELLRARALIRHSVEDFLVAQHRREAAPLIVGLREALGQVADLETERLRSRLPALSPEVRSEVEWTINRILKSFLHGPIVRATELAGRPDGQSRMDALLELLLGDSPRGSASERQPNRLA